MGAGRIGSYDGGWVDGTDSWVSTPHHFPPEMHWGVLLGLLDIKGGDGHCGGVWLQRPYPVTRVRFAGLKIARAFGVAYQVEETAIDQGF